MNSARAALRCSLYIRFRRLTSDFLPHSAQSFFNACLYAFTPEVFPAPIRGVSPLLPPPTQLGARSSSPLSPPTLLGERSSPPLHFLQSASGLCSSWGRLSGIVAPIAARPYIDGNSNGVLWLGVGGIFTAGFFLIFLPIETRGRQTY